MWESFPRVRGGWGTIVADPPWSFDDKGSRAAPDWRDAKGGYRTASPMQLLALPIGSVAAKRSHLYLWTTDAHLPLALTCMEAWGFTYKQTLAWVKLRNIERLQIGMGHWYRHAHELVLFGVRGSAPARTHALPSVFFAPRRRHSEKPEVLQDMAERMSPSPRLEVFARRYRAGWRCWGDQLEPQESAS